MKHLISFLLVLILGMPSGIAQRSFEFGTGCLPETEPASLPRQAKLMARDFDNLPSSHSLKEYCPAPQSQGQYGTCTSWATAYAFRTILEAVNNGWSDESLITDEAFSPLFVYAQIKHANDYECSMGSQISAAMRLLKSVGVVKKDVFNWMCINYVPQDVMDKAGTYRIKDFVTLIPFGQYMFDPEKVSVVRKAISQNKPVVIAMRVYPSFNTCGEVWDGNMMGMPGYHAMCVVGYDDERYGEGAFQIMNSWGEDWGDGGFTWVKYSDFCRTVDQAYTGMLPPSVKKNKLSGSMEIRLSTGETMQPVLDGSRRIPSYNMKGDYLSGTRYRLYVSNQEPAYVYIIGSDQKGNTSLVFPPAKNVSPALLYTNTHIAIPDEKWYIEMDNTVGKDYLCVLYSLKELDIEDILENIRSESGDIYAKLDKALGNLRATGNDVECQSNSMSFNAVTYGSVVPIISVITHR